jgi:deazaflavin-dependent oxidoreductase (nitroreductase family)
VGLTPNYVGRLEVPGRRTGVIRSSFMVLVASGGQRYVVALAGESEWVRNVRANPTVTLATKVGTARFTATEVPVPQRDPVLTAYRAKAGKTVDGYFAKLPDPADHPVFSLTPV